jgi:hypothetical protein
LSVLLGTQFYDGPPDAMRRQAQSADALRRLTGVVPVNVQWRDERCERPGVETLPILARDGRMLTGIPGRRKPIAVDLLDALAGAAAERHLRHFALVNADIIVRQRAIDRIHGEGRETYAFSRMNVDVSGRELGLTLQGIDMWAFDVTWWARHRHRFRPYILGEFCFDVVFAAIMMTHGDGAISNRDRDICHEDHPAQAAGAHAEYNYYLAALDAPYFTLWVEYWRALKSAREAGASEADEYALMKRMFVRRRSLAAALWHAGRSLRARWRYQRRLRARGADAR